MPLRSLRASLSLHATVITLTLALAACAAPESDVGAHGAAIISRPTTDGSCTAEQMAAAERVIRVGRIVATTPIFRSCVREALDGRDLSESAVLAPIGPYTRCEQEEEGVPKERADLLAYIDAAATSLNTATLICEAASPSGTSYAGWVNGNENEGVHQDATITEQIHVLGSVLDGVVSAEALRICESGEHPARSIPPCRALAVRPYAGPAALLWHESMHAHGFAHGRGTDAEAAEACGVALGYSQARHSVPYIVQACMREVLQRSERHCGAPSADLSELRLLHQLDDTTLCYIATDPLAPRPPRATAPALPSCPRGRMRCSGSGNACVPISSCHFLE